jgi:hypothetical protein
MGRKKFCVFGHHLFSANQLLATASAAFLKIQLHLKLPHLATFVFDHLQRITHAHKAHWIRYLPPVDTDVVFCVHAPTGGDEILVRDKIHILNIRSLTHCPFESQGERVPAPLYCPDSLDEGDC